MGRLIKAKRSLAKMKVDAILLTTESNILYFSGFYSEGAVLMIKKNGRPVFFIDNMNFRLAKKKVDTTDIDIVSGSVMSELIRHTKDSRLLKIGVFSDKVTVAFYSELRKSLKGIKLIDKSLGFESMREKKEDVEIRALRKAAKETIALWNMVEKEICVGMTEKQIASILDASMRAKGYYNSFPTIAAVGKNTSDPHAIPTAKKLKEGEHVLLDFGLKCKHYSSDLTRIWVKGRINAKIQRLIRAVDFAHDMAIKMIKPGISIGKVATAVNKYFIDNGLGGFICHSLGHGVGIDVHEKPFLRVGTKDRFKKGMVVTVEPGLYMPGLGGIRKEDMVLIKEKGCEVLTK